MLKDHLKLFRALSDEHRLEIIDLLIEKTAAHSEGKLSATALLEKFPFTQPTLSHHMKILCESDLVVRHKTGKFIFYTLDTSGIKQLGEFIDHLSQV
jgi:ArsR family transcriptional regulator